MIIVRASANRLLLCRLAIGGDYYTVMGVFKFESVAKKYVGTHVPEKSILVRISDRKWIVTSKEITEDKMKVEAFSCTNYESAKAVRETLP